MNVPFFRPKIDEGDVKAVSDCLRSGWLTSGPNVKAFEQEFADYVGAKHAIAVNSATNAAILLLQTLKAAGAHPAPLKSLNIAIPVWTFSGPAMMAYHLGANIILCDVDPHTLNLTDDRVMEACRAAPDVVMPTHFAGLPCDLTQFWGMGAILDDAAHAFPSVFENGKMVGAGGNQATFFSFYATKTLTTGEGGMITTGDDDLAQRLRQLRLHGFNRPIEDRYTNLKTGWAYDIGAPGWKFNMQDMAAALGRSQLKKAEADLVARRGIALAYIEALQSIAQMPAYSEGHAWHLFCIRVKDRDGFINRMAERGVQCSVHFIPLHHHSFWKGKLGPVKAPTADAVFEQVVSLPLFPAMTQDEISHVIDSVKKSL